MSADEAPDVLAAMIVPTLSEHHVALMHGSDSNTAEGLHHLETDADSRGIDVVNRMRGRHVMVQGDAEQTRLPIVSLYHTPAFFDDGRHLQTSVPVKLQTRDGAQIVAACDIDTMRLLRTLVDGSVVVLLHQNVPFAIRLMATKREGDTDVVDPSDEGVQRMIDTAQFIASHPIDSILSANAK